MADSEGDGDAVHVLDVDSDLGEPPLDSVTRSAAAAAEMPRPPSSNKASSSATPSPSISSSSTSSSPFVLNDRSVATGGALLAALLLLVIGKTPSRFSFLWRSCCCCCRCEKGNAKPPDLEIQKNKKTPKNLQKKKKKTAALFFRRPPNKNRRSAAGTRAALLAGPSGAGKTTLFLELTTKKNKYGTVASMTENEGVAAVLSSASSGNRNTLRRVPLVDAPGHPRLRALAASRAPAATAIVFVVDASDFLPRKAEAAEALAALLAGSWRRRKKGVAVLLACNKSDRGEAAHSPEFIRKRLEKEIEALIASAATGGLAGERNGGGGGGDGDGDDESGSLASLLRRAGEPFSFAGLSKAGGPALETCTCSALKGEIGSVSGFLAKHG